MEFPLSATVTLVTLGIYFRVLANVSKVRAKTDIWGPATSGSYELECAIRSQTNMTEHLVMFFPLLWLCAFLNSDLSAAVLGSLFPVGRIFYARNYPTGHRPGFLIQLFSEIALFLAVSFGLVFSVM
jgi:glutathione S-transferase